MLDIKSNNLFYHDSSCYGILKVLNYYDLEGLNVLVLCKPEGDATLRMGHHIPYKMSDIKDIFQNKVFRIDVVAIESDVDIINKVRKYTKLPIIIITKYISSFSLKDYEKVYSFRTIMTNGSTYKGLTGTRYSYEVSDSGGEYHSLDNIKAARIRDIKINSLINGEEL